MAEDIFKGAIFGKELDKVLAGKMNEKTALMICYLDKYYQNNMADKIKEAKAYILDNCDEGIRADEKLGVQVRVALKDKVNIDKDAFLKAFKNQKELLTYLTESYKPTQSDLDNWKDKYNIEDSKYYSIKEHSFSTSQEKAVIVEKYKAPKDKAPKATKPVEKKAPAKKTSATKKTSAKKDA